MSDDEKKSVVKVVFDGDELEAVRDGETAWVVLNRVCDVLGIKVQPQATKLRATQWATTTMIVGVAADGKRRAQLCLDVDTLAGWLFTINPTKVRAELRDKLVRYQRECARVLRDRFFGRPVAAAMPMFQQLERILLSRSHIRNNEHATGIVRSAIRAAASARRETFAKCHGALRRSLQIPGYQSLALNEVPAAIDWLHSHVKDTPVGLLARQLSLWSEA